MQGLCIAKLADRKSEIGHVSPQDLREQMITNRCWVQEISPAKLLDISCLSVVPGGTYVHNYNALCNRLSDPIACGLEFRFPRVAGGASNESSELNSPCR